MTEHDREDIAERVATKIKGHACQFTPEQLRALQMLANALLSGGSTAFKAAVTLLVGATMAILWLGFGAKIKAAMP